MTPTKRTERETARDYAMIFRHTILVGNPKRRHIFFGLAGFTERKTALAGRYMAEKWPQLYRDHVESRTGTQTRGDFFLLVEGPSWSSRLKEWGEAVHLGAITPDVVKKCGFKWKHDDP